MARVSELGIVCARGRVAWLFSIFMELEDRGVGSNTPRLYEKLAAVCFLIGSILFTVDGVGHCIENLTWHTILYAVGSALFSVGSALMLR